MNLEATTRSREDHLLEVQTSIFQLTGTRVFAVERGGFEQRNALSAVLLHGVTANAYVWDPVADALGRYFQTLAIDQRGHGRSTVAADGRYDAEAYAVDALEVIEALGRGPALLVGHSLGARNAMAAAVLRPDLVAGIVAIDYTAYIEPEVIESLQQRVRAGSRMFANHDEVVAYLESRYPLLPRDAIDRRANYGYARAPNGGMLPLADSEAMQKTCLGLGADLVETIRSLSVPTLIIRGEASALVSPRAFERTIAERADFERIVVAGADHYVPEEQPRAIADAVLAFSDRLWGTKALGSRIDIRKEAS